MAITKVVMPKLSDAMETGKLLKWLKQEGDRVEGGEILAEIETDKADIELEAFGSGVLRKILVAPGTAVKPAETIPLTVMPATADKYVRAQPTAAMWNAGKIHLPRNAPWVPSFLRVVLGFTGVGDTEDDEVDAMAAAFDALQAHGTGEITMGPARATTRSLLGMDGGIRSRLR